MVEGRRTGRWGLPGERVGHTYTGRRGNRLRWAWPLRGLREGPVDGAQYIRGTIGQLGDQGGRKADFDIGTVELPS